MGYQVVRVHWASMRKAIDSCGVSCSYWSLKASCHDASTTWRCRFTKALSGVQIRALQTGGKSQVGSDIELMCQQGVKRAYQDEQGL